MWTRSQAAATADGTRRAPPTLPHHLKHSGCCALFVEHQGRAQGLAVIAKWRPELLSVLKVYFECLSS